MRVGFLVALLATCAAAVERANFKTCEQSGFCNRLRTKQAGEPRYSIDAATVAIDDHSLSATLVDERDDFKLGLQVLSAGEGVARLRIFETNPLSPRYEVADIISAEASGKLEQVERTDAATRVRLAGSDYVIELQHKPFRVAFYDNGDLVLSANSHNLLDFEYLRLQPMALDEPQRGEDGVYLDATAGAAYERNVRLRAHHDEERFKNFPDSRPNGPSAVAMDWTFEGAEHVYGIPSHADTLALKDTDDTDPYRLYNLDVFEFELYNPMALYGSIPLMLAHSAKRTVALFWLNASETWIDILRALQGAGKKQKATRWMSESGIIDTFVLFGPKPRDVAQQYARLTGQAAMPPKWSLAYHQCRWNYNSVEDVLDVDNNFDVHDIPYDTIWLDIEHTNDKRYFTWHPSHFSEPIKMQDHLKAKQRHLVVIIDPHIKRDSGYHIHKGAQEKGLYVKNKHGSDYDGWCWPGSSSYLDFLRPEVREYWGDSLQLDAYQGSTDILHVWNDMNEPSVFNGPEISMHKDAVHNGTWEHRDVHNLYGIMVHRATYEGLMRRNDERPFVLSRAYYAGSQKYGAIWTGDNAATWEHLRVSPQMLLSVSISGLPFVGVDVGGFFGNPEAELMVRWYQAGIFYPFFRAHAHLDSNRREPWLFGAEDMARIRRAVKVRYALLSFWYTVFYEAHVTGLPVMRPLWFEFGDDAATFGMDDGYLVGANVLVNPVYAKAATTKSVYFPRATWYSLFNNDVAAGPQTRELPVDMDSIIAYQRAGSILPMQLRPRRNSNVMRNDPYTLRVALDDNERAEGTLFMDDERTFAYQSGAFAYRRYTFEKGVLTSASADAAGSFKAPNTLERVVVLGLKKAPQAVTAHVDGRQVPLIFMHDPVSQTLTIRNPGLAMSADWSIAMQ